MALELRSVIHDRDRILWLLLITLALSLGAAPPGDASGSGPENGAKRPFRIDDRLDEEELASPLLSPDGEIVAFVRRRPASAQTVNVLEISETQDDIWMQRGPGKEAKNLTNGASDSSGAWAPQWSPDGQYLSFLSSRGGNVAVWVWDRRTDSLRQASDVGIEFRGLWPGCRWQPDQRMVCLATPDGERSAPTNAAGDAVAYAKGMWDKVARGEPAINAADSTAFQPNVRRLVLVDPRRRTTKELGTVHIEQGVNTWWLSPDGQTLAFVRPASSPYTLNTRARMGFPVGLELRRLDGSTLQLTGELPTNVLAYTVKWSPDGRALAFFALGDAKIHPRLVYGEEVAKDVEWEPVASVENPAKLWRVDVPGGSVSEVDTGDIDIGQNSIPPSFQWLASRELLFQANRLQDRMDRRRDGSLGWWVLDVGSGATRKLITASSATFNQLESIDGGRSLLALSNKEIWQVDSASGSVRNLTEHFAPPVHRYRTAGTGRDAALLLKAGDPRDELGRSFTRNNVDAHADGVGDYILSLQTGAIAPAPRPEPKALLKTFHAPSRTLLYQIDDNEGSRLWRGTIAPSLLSVASPSEPSPSWERLAVANLHHRTMAVYEERILEYTTMNGAPVLAMVTFPLDYVEGRKYPVVVDSDIGYTPSSSRHLFTIVPDIRPVWQVQARTFASAGYIYMFTSAPTRNTMDDAGRGNLLLFTDGILAAVDAAIRAGFADPDRFVLYGASSFGFGVLGTITQTPRFKAAVAEASWADQGTYPLLLDDVERYSPNSFGGKGWFKPLYSESNLPFWKNGDHYRRNSPLTYVDRVKTPLLLIQGEFDGSPMSQLEMFFSALIQQRKKARFLRYFGEQHMLTLPAHLKNKYREIFAWFDEHSDIQRDAAGSIVFEGDRPKSRQGRPALKPKEFSRFGPAVEASPQQTIQP